MNPWILELAFGGGQPKSRVETSRIWSEYGIYTTISGVQNPRKLTALSH